MGGGADLKSSPSWIVWTIACVAGVLLLLLAGCLVARRRKGNSGHSTGEQSVAVGRRDFVVALGDGCGLRCLAILHVHLEAARVLPWYFTPRPVLRAFSNCGIRRKDSAI